MIHESSTNMLNVFSTYNMQNISEKKNHSHLKLCYNNINNELIKLRIKEGRTKEIMIERKDNCFKKFYLKMTVCILKTEVFSLLKFCCYYT